MGRKIAVNCDENVPAIVIELLAVVSRVFL
jgi:hypothetical protein